MSTESAQPARMIFAYPAEPVLAAIGRVSLRHGQLDHVLRMTVKTITGLGIEEATNATERQGSAALRERVRKLARQRLGESVALVRLDALLTRARRATERRNELLHGVWAVDLEGGEFFQHDGRVQRVPDPAALDQVADELAAIARELNLARLEQDGFLRLSLEARSAASVGPSASGDAPRS